MEDYYITKPSLLGRDENTIQVINETGKIKIPVTRVDSIFMLSGGTISQGAFSIAAKNHIPIHIFSYSGFYQGTFYPRIHNVSGDVLVKQVEAYLSNEKRLLIAKKIVEGSANNMLRNLKRWGKNHDTEEEWNKVAELIADMSMGSDIKEIMSFEGQIRKIYYKGMSKCIPFEFSKRTRHPPSNPSNAIISFGNSLMCATVLSQIYKTRLDPRVSFLHEPFERRFSLSLDISDIFKPLIVDRLIVDLLSHRTISEKHFDETLNYAYLNTTGRQIFIKKYDEKLNTTVHHKTLDRKVSYKRIILLELYKLEKHILGIRSYEPFIAWW